MADEPAGPGSLADAVGAPLAVTMYGERVDIVGGDAQDEDSDDDSEDTGALRTALAKVRAAIERTARRLVSRLLGPGLAAITRCTGVRVSQRYRTCTESSISTHQ